jgi:hypothetical protein
MQQGQHTQATMEQYGNNGYGPDYGHQALKW